MQILFDVWIRDNNNLIYTPQEVAAFEAIFNYIYDRVYHIIDEIDKEEMIDEMPRAIIVYLLKKPYAIQPVGYSENLHNRIVGCFNENDSRLLWESVASALLKFMN